MLHYFQEDYKRVSTEAQQFKLDLSARFQYTIAVCSLSLV